MQKFKTLRQTLDLAEEEQLLEKLKASDPTGKWVSDFVHSDNPRFADKSKKERINMALGASYAAKGQPRNEEIYKDTGWKISKERKDPQGNITKKKNVPSKLAKQGMKQAGEKGFGPSPADKLSIRKEEVDELDEISKKTLGSYISKAAVDMTHKTSDATQKRTMAGANYAHNISRGMDTKTAGKRLQADYDDAKPDTKKAVKRMYGIDKAVSRMTKEEVEDKPGIHKVSVTINDKDKDDRDMKIEKMLKVKANNQAAALAIAKKHYGGKGYKIHNASYHGIHEEGRLSSGAKDPCWKGYEMVGTKKKNGREVPNCVPKKKD